jgi:hypothetical protein
MSMEVLDWGLTRTLAQNTRFILEHEERFAGMERRWLLNRIADPAEEDRIAALLDRHNETYFRRMRRPWHDVSYHLRKWSTNFPFVKDRRETSLQAIRY